MFNEKTFVEMLCGYYKSARTERLGQYAVNHYLREWDPLMVDPQLFYEENNERAINIIVDKYCIKV